MCSRLCLQKNHDKLCAIYLGPHTSPAACLSPLQWNKELYYTRQFLQWRRERGARFMLHCSGPSDRMRKWRSTATASIQEWEKRREEGRDWIPFWQRRRRREREAVMLSEGLGGRRSGAHRPTNLFGSGNVSSPKMRVDHWCMMSKDVKNIKGNPNECGPLSLQKYALFGYV